MRQMFACALGLLLLSATAQGQDRVPLFDGTFAGWTLENVTDNNITVGDGVLRLSASSGWLKSTRTYADFLLRVEFRFLTDDTDSGIFVRTVADSVFARGWPSNGYQIQLRNPVLESRFPAVGGIFRHGKPPGETVFDAPLAASTSRGTGEWQEIEVELTGAELQVRLNGTVLTRASGIGNATGYIGLQAEAGTLEVRSIEIEERDRK